MAEHPDAPLDEHLWSVAVARIVLGAGRPRAGAAEPRLRRLPAAARRGDRRLGRRLARHGRPRQSRGAVARAVERLREACRSRGLELAPRLPLYPEHVAELDRWADPAVAPAIRRVADALGLAREDRWAPGEPVAVPFIVRRDAAPLELAGDELGEEELVRLFAARGRRARARARGGRPASARGLRRRGDLRRHAEHPVHERLLLQVRLLRLLEGQARREPPRPRVPRPARRDRAPRPRGLGARCDRGLPPGRDPPVVHRRLLRERRRVDQRRGARDPRPRVLRARGVAGRRDARARSRRRTSRGSATSGSARSPAPRPRSSTTRCARSSARTR